ncbi:MAG: insulinase family protein [Elusimicrobiota bacterium]|nr:insulinase family protein [Elusimicrobiota bacterium]MDH5662057.1 insulinase family protein [Elusimicrobiota bacterium]
MYKKCVLDNGLKVIIAPMKGTRAVTVLILVGTGSRYETEQLNGITHFLEHMLFRGTSKRPSAKVISESIDRVGGELNAYASEESTGFFIHLASSHLEVALDVLSDMLLNSKFEKEEIEKEKGVIMEEINMHQDKPDVQVSNIYKSLLYGNQPLGWEVIGKKEVIKNIDREKLLAYRRKHFSSNNTVISIAGDVRPGKTSALIKKYLSRWKNRKRPSYLSLEEKQTVPAITLQYRKTDQSYICLGVRTFAYEHPDYYVLRILNTILGGMVSSRLFVRLREEEGIAYSVDSLRESYLDGGNLRVNAGVEIRKTEAAIGAILEEFARLCQEIVGEEELRKGKEYLKGRLALELELSPGVAGFLGHQELLLGKIKLPEEQIREIEKVSSPDINRVAKTIFVKEHLNLAVVGPFKDRQIFKKLLKF